MDAWPVYYVALAPNGRVQWMTRKLRDELGYEAGEVAGAEFSRRFLPADVRPKWTELLERLMCSELPLTEQIPLLTRAGRTISAEWRFWMRRDDVGRILGIEGTDVDATSNTDSSRWLLSGVFTTAPSIQEQLGLLEYVADHVALIGPNRNVLYVNRSFETLYGVAREQVVGKSISEVWAGRIDEHRLQEIHYAISDGNVYRGEFVTQNGTGELFYDELTVTPLRGLDGAVRHFLAVGRDATAKRLTDPSTGLQTRALLLERVRLAIARAKRHHADAQQFALLFFDVDRFKVINDTYGMSVGDQVILELSRRLSSAVGTIDAVAQVGHLNRDEFAVLLEDLSDPSDARTIAERLLAELRKPIVIGVNEFVLSISVGIASASPRYERAEEILRDAETAMTMAKASPSESLRIFDPALHERARLRTKLGNELRRAIATDEIVAFYQPIVSLEHGGITGAEALVRWRHPTRGLVPPAEFIPAAEESGLIVPLGQRVLREACRQLAEWHAAGFGHLTMAVNVSLRQFRDHSFVQSVHRVLTETGVNPSAVKLELTESTAADDPDAMVHIIGRLKDLGVQTLMDDFGTGYSSLSYLTRLALDKLKIDRSFIMRIPGSAHDSLVASSILVLAHNLGLGVIAEGVETEPQLEFLRQLGCDEIQGYLFSPPVGDSEFTRLLTDRYTLSRAVTKKREAHGRA